MTKLEKLAKVAKKFAEAVAAKRLFTAFELSQELNAENGEGEFDPLKVRENGKAFLGNGLLEGYTRTRVTLSIPTDCGQVAVYHPIDVDVYNYPLAVKPEASPLVHTVEETCPHCGETITK